MQSKDNDMVVVYEGSLVINPRRAAGGRSAFSQGEKTSRVDPDPDKCKKQKPHDG